jgi:hypothetical protein
VSWDHKFAQPALSLPCALAWNLGVTEAEAAAHLAALAQMMKLALTEVCEVAKTYAGTGTLQYQW